MDFASTPVNMPTVPYEFKRMGLIILLLAVIYWSYQLLRPYPEGATPWIFLDYLNLIFHEAGHWVFGIFGQTIGILGGSLMQTIIPLSVLITFLRSNDLPGAGFGLFWLGNNLVNVSYYIADSQMRSLTLLGGDTVIHDWQWLLTEFGWIEHTQLIGIGVRVLGGGCLLIAAAFLLLALIGSPKDASSARNSRV